MKKYAAIIISFSLMLPPIAYAQPNTCKKSIAEVLSVEKSIATALVANDVAAIDKLLAPDYTFTIANGMVISRAQTLSDMQQWWKPISVVYSEQSGRCNANVVTVLGKTHYEWREQDKVLTATEKYTDTYVKLSGKWQRISSHASCLAGKCS